MIPENEVSAVFASPLASVVAPATQRIDIAAMAARVVSMESADAMQNRKDVDRRVDREKAIGEQMLRDFKAIAASCGVDVPEKIGGCGGWLAMLSNTFQTDSSKRVLRARWTEYEAFTGFKKTRLKQLFRWGHSPEEAVAELKRNREDNAVRSGLRTKLRRLLNEQGEKAVIEFIERGFKDA